MIAVHIQGLQDGQVPIDITASASEISALAPEFIDEIRLQGTLTRTGRRFTLTCTVDAMASLVCDRSLEEYEEPISVRLDLEFEFDTQAAIDRAATDGWGDDGIIPIRDDAKLIDLTDDVRQELVVHLPLRRVAPKYRDKEIDEIFPELADHTEEDHVSPPDDTWAALRNLKQQ